ncbi:transporter [Carnobacterium sp. 17-4]|uniref:phosphonate ABC transporter, permease protein PhnE n=1 Tax=Carnobacterium sp. (strain 17-4) TaxID=208596 RepID=UPI0002059223|nr:phosphonate ABC transporter, permease protein PhnE [Carnobacterium sp. 17-4]AEB29219.1 transporter [Carnobacterium sp. 17-4]
MELTTKRPQPRGWKTTITFLILLLLAVGATILLEFNYSEALFAFPNAAMWIIQNFYPNAEAWLKLPNIVEKLVETVLMAIASATTASFFAYIFALFGAEATKFNSFLSWASKLFASFFRNVPDIVWSMIFLFSFGMSIMTGFLALFFVTFGMMNRAFIETIDETSSESVEALTATGANWWQIVGQAIFPNSISGVISWVLYSIENNIRSATLIGMLTGSGIGHIFNLYYKNLDYHSCSLVVLCIMVVVLVLEGISNRVRRSIL